MEPPADKSSERSKEQPVPAAVDGADAALSFVWAQYKTWDITSNASKKMLSRWKNRVFVLVIFGSLTAVLGGSFSELGLGFYASGLGMVSAVAVALSAYATSQVLTEEAEKSWVRARAAAESFKSEAYLYQQKASPYDGEEASEVLFERTESMIKSMADLSPKAIGREEQLEGLPQATLSFDEYLQERIYDQAYGYYLPKTQYFQQLLRRGKNWGFALGFVSIILGTLSASGFSELSVWIAFIGSTASSITAFISSNRYQYLVVSYQATANRLMMLLARSSKVAPGNIKAQQQFVAECEEAISLENKAWIAELSEKKENDKTE